MRRLSKLPHSWRHSPPLLRAIGRFSGPDKQGRRRQVWPAGKQPRAGRGRGKRAAAHTSLLVGISASTRPPSSLNTSSAVGSSTRLPCTRLCRHGTRSREQPAEEAAYGRARAGSRAAVGNPQHQQAHQELALAGAQHGAPAARSHLRPPKHPRSRRPCRACRAGPPPRTTLHAATRSNISTPASASASAAAVAATPSSPPPASSTSTNTSTEALGKEARSAAASSAVCSAALSSRSSADCLVVVRLAGRRGGRGREGGDGEARSAAWQQCLGGQ